MKAIALRRVLLAASLLVTTACAERIAACPTPGGREIMAAGSGRCSATDAVAAELALDHRLDADPVLSVAPPQRRKARPAMHAQYDSKSSGALSAMVESLASGPPGQKD